MGVGEPHRGIKTRRTDGRTRTTDLGRVGLQFSDGLYRIRGGERSHVHPYTQTSTDLFVSPMGNLTESPV